MTDADLGQASWVFSERMRLMELGDRGMDHRYLLEV